MALSGDDKEMRLPGNLGYNNNNPLHEDLDHLQPQDQLQIHQQDKSTTAAPYSGGSKPKTTASSRSTSMTTTTRYRECLKNHAASIGGNVTDGCGEFMPSGEEGTLEALKCAACNCHRNFHRKESNGDALIVHPLQLPPALPSPSMSQHRMGLHHNNHHWTSVVQPVKMAFGGGGSVATDSSSEELNFNAFQSNNNNSSVPPPPFALTKKRFRTKFTQEQKERMLEFAEKLGWRIPREDDSQVQRFCAEVGVKRQVFKVWMHNNKNSAKKNPEDQS